MPARPLASLVLEHEARALLTRLARVAPFALRETMVPAANLSIPALAAIERFLLRGRRELARLVSRYITWIRGRGRFAPPSLAQRRFTFLRLRFNAVLTQFDIFSVVMTQRSEHALGVWLSGLVVAAADALALPRAYFSPPALAVYLDRGHGAAIRRVRTRLPGGGPSPIAVIRIPRERMVGSGIASSLVHEVGHQAAALLGLVASLREVLRGLRATAGPQRIAWQLFDRWISEIVADFWAVARVGIAAPMGLMAVVSLPRVFVFRIDTEDPHPAPWVRVKLSCAMGDALYPHPQWQALAALWESFYPLDGIDPVVRDTIAALEATTPAFVNLIVNHRPRSLGGHSLREALDLEERQPARLQAIYSTWRRSRRAMRRTPPALAFAVLGQARADGRLTPEQESALVAELLTYWALRSTLDASEACAAAAARPAPAVETPILQ